MRKILLQLAHLGLRARPTPGGNGATEVCVRGGWIAAGQRKAPCQLVGQSVNRIKPALAGEPDRLLVLLKRDAVHPVQTHDFGVDQRLFIRERAGINARPEGDFVVVGVNAAAVVRREGLRRQLTRKRQRAVEMVIQQMDVPRRGPRVPPRHLQIRLRVGVLAAGKVRHAAIEPVPEQHGGGLLRGLLRRRGKQRLGQDLRRGPGADDRRAQELNVAALHHQNAFHVLEVGFTHERQAAIDAGQYPVQVIAPREEVDHLVAGRKAGHRHIPVGDRRAEAGFRALDGERQRLGPDAELVERQQGLGFKGIVAVAGHQLAGQRAVLKPEAILGVAVAHQHAKPGHRRGGGAGDAVVEGQVHHAAEQ